MELPGRSLRHLNCSYGTPDRKPFEGTQGQGPRGTQGRTRLSRKQTFQFELAEKPYEAGLDPMQMLIDRVPSDNLKKVY